MSRAKIQNGVWIRKIPISWEKKDVWRTDIFKSVLADPKFMVAEFQLEDGSSVRVSKEELQRVLVGGPDHYYGSEIWGPFDIDPTAKTISGQKVRMEVVKKLEDITEKLTLRRRPNPAR